MKRRITRIIINECAAVLILSLCLFTACSRSVQIQNTLVKPTANGQTAGPPVIEGQSCDVIATLNNPTKDILIVSSIYTNRSADGRSAYMKSQYGSVGKNESGQLIYDSMRQMLSPDVFFDPSAVVLPKSIVSFPLSTRFFGQERKITFVYYRIPESLIPEVIFIEKETTNSLRTLFRPVMNKDEIKAKNTGALKSIKNSFILWKNSAPSPEEASFSLNPVLTEAPFSLKTARTMLPQKIDVKEISYCDTFNAWVFQTDGAAWLVRKSEVEQFGNIELLVFEKIDSAGGNKLLFRVPEKEFAGNYTLEEGDGMYRIGKFLTVSGENILDVFRTLRDAGLACRFYDNFFGWWFETKKPQ